MIYYYAMGLNYKGEVEQYFHHDKAVSLEHPMHDLVRKLSFDDLMSNPEHKEVKVFCFGYDELGRDSFVNYSTYIGFSEPKLVKFNIIREEQMLLCSKYKRLYFQAEKCENFIDIAGEVFCFNPDLYLLR